MSGKDSTCCKVIDQRSPTPGPVRGSVGAGPHKKLLISALKSLLPFPASYLCEAGFSAMAATKTKQRNKLDISKALRVSLALIIPDGTVSL